MFKLLKYLKGYSVVTILAPLLKLAEAIFELIVPLVVAQIIDVGIVNGDTRYVLIMGGVMVGLGALGLILALISQYFSARASMGFGTNLRTALYKHINTLATIELDKIGASSLVTRLTSDIIQAQTGVSMFLRLVLRSPFIAIGATIMAIIISPSLSLIFLAMAVAVSVVLWLIMSRTTPSYRKIQAKLDDVALLTRENLSGARVIRALCREKTQENEYKDETEKLSTASIRVNMLSALLNPLTYAIINVAVICVLWFGGKKVYAGALSQGEVYALVNYLSQILLALIVTANLAVTFTKASASASRINEVFSLSPTIISGDVIEAAPTLTTPKISFKNVTFSYGDNAGASLKNISFDIFAGETIGIIGSTGSGKSTLVNLIPRLYDVTNANGGLFVDGVNARDYNLQALRAKIGLVPQHTTLFSGTIRENMLFACPTASDDDIWQALKIAQAYEFVAATQNKLDTVINRDAHNISGGQRQRLTIARALMLKPEVLILDDSASALDYATDACLTKSLKTLENITIIKVSQRATSILSANKIIALDDGAIVGIGSHKELINTCKIYKEIYTSQN